MKSITLKLVAIAILFSCFYSEIEAQQIDSTQIGQPYPYVLPILGEKAYQRGYKLQKPFGGSVGTIFNKQGIILDNFQFAFASPGEGPDYGLYQPLADLVEFGPSEGRINTLNFRVDAWILPFLSVGAYAGKVWGEQTITLTAPVAISSTTDIRGDYYGFNLLGVAPLGPVNLAADYSWSWTTNERLDEPVRVEVAGLRVIKPIYFKKPDRFISVWGGAQFQKLASRTSGNISLEEALSLDGSTLDAIDGRLDEFGETLDGYDMAWEDYMNSPTWEELPQREQIKQETTYNTVRGILGAVEEAGIAASEVLRDISEKTVYYQFDKRLEFDWNMLLGFNYQHNPNWQFRAEYGFLQSKQQLMFMLNYRFGI